MWILQGGLSRLCFSIVPALTAAVGIPVLLYLYPAAAKDDMGFLVSQRFPLYIHLLHMIYNGKRLW